MSDKIFFRGFNEIRAIAALLVLFHHIELYRFREKTASLYDNSFFHNFISNAGKNGVYLFFCLSGFLITYLLMAEKQKTGTISIKNFYIRRILRIWPLYYLVLLIAFGGLYFLFISTGFFSGENYAVRNQVHLHTNYFTHLLLYLFFVPNLAASCGYFVNGASQLWSVGVEEQFYLVWPLIMKFIRKKILPVLVAILGLKILCNVFLVRALAHFSFHTFLGMELSEWSTFLKLFRIEFMSMGAIMAYLTFHYSLQIKKIFAINAVSIFIGLGTAILLFLETDPVIVAVGFSLTIASIANQSCLLFETKLFGFMGKISYGIYMYHPVIMLLTYALLHKMAIDTPLLIILAYVIIPGLTILVSYLSYEYFEKRLLRMKSRYAAVKSGNEE